MEITDRYEVVTKLDAAERQLAVAIRMFFERKDMIAVHTLATAAQQVLCDLAVHRGIESIFEDDRLKEMRPILRLSQNFLKHADNDPDGELPFFPESTKFHLFDAAILAARLTGGRSPEVIAFLGWFMNQFPYLFNTTDAPGLAAAIEFAKEQNFDNFALVLIAIDKHAKGR